MFELTHIARPGIDAEQLLRVCRKGARRLAFAFGARHEMIRQQRNVIHPIPQRGHMDRRAGQPVIEILPQGAGLHRL